MKLLNPTVLFSSFLLLSSCGGENEKKSESSIPDNAQTKNDISVYEADIAQTFDEASLKLISPVEGEAKEGSNTFTFEVSNYTLGAQTEDSKKPTCANSEQGQHIHFIVNNQPYLALYEAEFEAELSGDNNIILAFLSRSYHESIKNDAASVLFARSTSADTVYTENEEEILVTHKDSIVDLSDPMLFYSRPKGSYSGKDTKKILLDFYLKNVELSKEGYKVKAIINGNEFILDKWVPYFVEGLPMGENTFQLQLIDENGKVTIPEGEGKSGLFNDSGERIVKLAEG